MTRIVRTDGPLTTRVSEGLGSSLGEDLREVMRKARQVVERLPDPVGRPLSVVGLMLGRIQAGKTNAMIVTSAVAVDNGYKLVIVLTSDNTWLYEQTLGRFKKALPSITSAGYTEWEAKRRQIETGLSHGAAVLVTTKNGKRLRDLLRLLRRLNAGDVPALIFDDEADQASLNTNAQKPDAETSTINSLITDIRTFFRVNGFLQVTATPQALLLQDRNSAYRPEFVTVLEPGTGYVGGDIYFADDSKYLHYVPLDEVVGLKSSEETAPSLPQGLEQALCTFFVGASAKLLVDGEKTYSCLVHVSLKTQHHERLRDIIQEFIAHVAETLRGSGGSLEAERVRRTFKAAYENLAGTAGALPPFEKIISFLAEMILGTDVQVLNSKNEAKQPRYDARYNILVGGTKLGRGVTIPGLLVTYYGRESKNPQMDTVQQHARMYGYRGADLPLSRIFLPRELAEYFRGINLSENELRDWLKGRFDTRFEPQIIPMGMKATRSNVLNPTTVGCYIPGKAYTPGPAAFLNYRNKELTAKLDQILGVPPRGNHQTRPVTIDEMIGILSLIRTDPHGRGRWEDRRIMAALKVLKDVYGNTGDLAVFAGRRLRPNEKPNVADSDDLNEVRRDLPGLLMFRQDGRVEEGWEGIPFWIPVVRFPDGRYPIAFNFT